jgi:hypothetical protein
LQNGDEEIDEVVEFEDPDKTDFASSSEDVIVGNFALPTGIIQLLVGGQFH